MASFPSMPIIVGIIPARYESSRFPGKPLALILNKSLIQHTYENANRCKLFTKLIIATDDQRIYKHAQSFGAEVVMTSPQCPTGTDRLVEVLKSTPSIKDASIIINVQGDEPCLNLENIEKTVHLLLENPNASMSTLCAPLRSKEEAFNPSIVKCTIDQHGNALYFSRALIPYGKNGVFLPNVHYYRHLGIYGFRRDFLLKYAVLPPTPLQIAEDLEQLKALEHGYSIKVGITEHYSPDVNTPEDIKKVESFLCP